MPSTLGSVMNLKIPAHLLHSRRHDAAAPRIIGHVSSSILTAAAEQPLPERFVQALVIDKPQVTITDSETGRCVVVSLCNLRGVRRILNGLFS